jgi:hypothetical protein
MANKNVPDKKWETLNSLRDILTTPKCFGKCTCPHIIESKTKFIENIDNDWPFGKPDLN